MDKTDLKLPLAQPLDAIGRKWIAYAQRDNDSNDIAYAIWHALHDAAQGGAIYSEPAAVPVERKAPVQGYQAGIPWSLHLEAYDDYAKKYGTSQTAERLAERGGFGTRELDEHIPGWREKVSTIADLQARLEAAQERYSELFIAYNEACADAVKAQIDAERYRLLRYQGVDFELDGQVHSVCEYALDDVLDAALSKKASKE